VADIWLAIGGVLAVAVAAGSRRMDELPFTETALALVVGVLLGPRVLGVLELADGEASDVLNLVARLTLAVALMAIALRYPLGEILERRRSVLWLLALVLPGMAAVGSVLAWGILAVPVGAALVIGTSLAPTDPVLASGIVSGEPAERTLPSELRQRLSLESGANDGLAFPLVLVAASVAAGTSTGGALLAAVWSVAGAIAIGVVLGWSTARLLLWAEQHGDVDPSREVLSSLLLALGALGIASLARTDGLLAVFVTGLAYNAATTGRERRAEERIDEAVNRFLVLPLFLLVGVLLPWGAWGQLGWRGPVLTAAVLLLRRLPLVWVARRLVDTPRPADALWLGWFGPIGVAAVYYLTEVEALGVHDPVVWAGGSMVVAASTLVHGVTASPWRAAYARVSRTGRDP
jgi:sodium/hydrogen antiporter